MNELLRKALSLGAVIAIAITGCGGGTTGSGDASGLRITGTVTSPDGTPIAAATISDLVSGTSTYTNSSGTFALDATRHEGEVSLDVTAQGTSGTITVPNVPDSTSTIAIKVVIDSVSGVVSLASVELDTSTPTTPSEKVSQQVKGFILSRSNKPVSGALVSIENTSARQTTDLAGRFVMTGHSQSGTLTLQVSYQGHSGTATISGIPTNRPVGITVRLTLSVDAGQDPGDGSGGGSSLSINLHDVEIS